MEGIGIWVGDGGLGLTASVLGDRRWLAVVVVLGRPGSGEGLNQQVRFELAQK